MSDFVCDTSGVVHHGQLKEMSEDEGQVIVCVCAGTGKTAIMRDKLRNMDAEVTCSSTINMNSFSDAPTLQPILEQPLEKKSGQQSKFCIVLHYKIRWTCLSPGLSSKVLGLQEACMVQ